MPHFCIEKKNSVDKTFRVSKVLADFDMQLEHSNETFEGDINLSDSWNIGVIHGASGTGKSTIAKEIFGEPDHFEYDERSVLDNMPKKCGIDEITRMFFSVGFGSSPSWLKPYSVLSNGEKMRVDFARSLLEKDFVIFDEFTSVVDRNVARTMCKAINKYMKAHPDKKFIAVSCHEDILDYLNVDWVFNTNTMQMDFRNGNRKNSSSTFAAVPETNGENLASITI